MLFERSKRIIFEGNITESDGDIRNKKIKVILCSAHNLNNLEVILQNQNFVQSIGFSAMPGEALCISEPGRLILLAGVGEAASLTTDIMRQAGAAVINATPHAQVLELDRDAFMDIYNQFRPISNKSASTKEIFQLIVAFGQGISLASYSFDKYLSLGISKNKKARGEDQVRISFPQDSNDFSTEIATYAELTAKAVYLARDLINEPAGSLPPSRFADIAMEVAKSANLTVDILDEQAVKQAGLGGLLGVSKGSDEECRLVKMTYKTDPSDRAADPGKPVLKVALVGKGITFDSGGLSLKSPEAMMTMKTDMSGAAAVLAVMSVLDDLKIPVDVVGVMPMSENLPSGSATKPGDVLKTRSGQSIEVLNTDAEGRLVLADALTLAAEEKPDAIIDLATLTGACVVALGESIAGVMTNDQRLMDMILGASKISGEKFWQLPLPDIYKSMIESEIADMKNVASKPKAGALIGGLILERFVGGIPWAHIDMAGPARSDSKHGFLTKGATGFGVLTLIELLQSWQTLGGNAMGAKNC